MTWLLLAVAAVLLAAGALLGRRRVRLRDPAVAMDDAAARLPGFQPVSAVVGDDGQAALTVAADGRIALLTARRGPPRVDEVAWSAMRATSAGIEVRPAARSRVLLRGVDALDVRRLAPTRERLQAAE